MLQKVFVFTAGFVSDSGGHRAAGGIRGWSDPRAIGYHALSCEILCSLLVLEGEGLQLNDCVEIQGRYNFDALSATIMDATNDVLRVPGWGC